MNWKETFYTGKREHPQEKKPASLTALLMPSLLGMAMCLVCLCSLTWAWFTATQNSGVQPIQSATATVTAITVDVGGERTLSADAVTMESASDHIMFNMTGNARRAYVLIQVSDGTYHTDYLTEGFYRVNLSQLGTVKLTLCWGDYTGKGTLVANGDTITMPEITMPEITMPEREDPVNTEQPAAGDNDQQTPDATVPANGDANTGSGDASTGDQTGSGENTGNESGGTTGDSTGEQGSDPSTGDNAGESGDTGSDAGTGDTPTGTDGTTGK